MTRRVTAVHHLLASDGAKQPDRQPCPTAAGCHGGVAAEIFIIVTSE